jgi:hypothetical protein
MPWAPLKSSLGGPFPGQAIFQFTEQTGGPQSDAHVKIMAAGVHHPVHCGAPGGRHLFGNRQGVHIRPVGHHLARAGAAEAAHHSVPGHAGLDVQAQVSEVFSHHPGGALLLMGQLRVLVEFPS